MSDYIKSKEQLAESQKKIDSAMGKNDPAKGIRDAFNNIKSAFSPDHVDRALRERQKKVVVESN